MNRSLITIIFCFLSSCSATNNTQKTVNTIEQQLLSSYVEKEWHVSEPLTIEYIEKRAMEERVRYRNQPNARKDVPMVPFGFANDKWIEFKSKVKAGDEIRKISSPSIHWSRLAGWEGYILSRGEYVVWQMMTKIN